MKTETFKAKISKVFLNFQYRNFWSENTLEQSALLFFGKKFFERFLRTDNPTDNSTYFHRLGTYSSDFNSCDNFNA